MKRNTKKILTLALSVAMVLSLSGISDLTPKASAKAKKMTLSAKNITLTVKKSKKVKVKNAPKKAVKKWKSANKKIAKVNKTGKITGVKKGKTKVTCTITYKGKKTKLKVNVTVKAAKKEVAPTETTTATAPAIQATPVVSASPAAPAEPTPTVYPTDTETSNLTDEHKSANGQVTKDNGLMRTNWTSKEYMKAMGFGWNYGNSLEQAMDRRFLTDEEYNNLTVNDCETSANNLALTQANVHALKRLGFNNVRIPVAWSNMVTISEDGMTYTLNEGLLDRVEEVVNYALNEEMYVIVNIHWDGGWWGQFGDADPEIRKQAWARFEQYWTQIANRYKEYSDRLVFEGANEELGDRLNGNWRTYNSTDYVGTLSLDEQYEVMNQINQKFVDVVRSTGGNNTYRYLLIPGYFTNVDSTSDDRFHMPTDLTENGNNKLSLSVHYYTPWYYCGGNEYHQEPGGHARAFTWGSDEDIAAMHADVDKMKKFTDQGYGIIWGEFGVQTTGVDGIPTYFQEFAKYTMENGMVPVL